MPGKRVESLAGALGDSGRVDHLPRIIACENRLEEALHFLVMALGAKAKRGKKPVAVHSLRVSMKLGAMGCHPDVVVAGLLHDVVEKTSIRPFQVARRFGPRVAAMVQATTNNAKIDDPLRRYHDSLKRCAALGEGALLVRGADLIDNCDRLMALGSTGKLARLAAKLSMLIQVGTARGVDARMIGELKRRYRMIGASSRRRPIRLRPRSG